MDVDRARECALERVRKELATRGAGLVGALGLGKPFITAGIDVVRQTDGLLVSLQQKADLRHGSRVRRETNDAGSYCYLLQHTCKGTCSTEYGEKISLRPEARDGERQVCSLGAPRETEHKYPITRLVVAE